MPGNIDHYQISKLIGEGAYGKVYKAKHIPTGKIVAIKVINTREDPRLLHLQLVMIARELQTLFKLSRQKHNQFTPILYDAFVNQEASTNSKKLNRIYLVMEHYDFDL